MREILNENPSYVFFKFGGRGPTGAMGHEVDDWLSLATDRSYIPLGSLVAYGVNAPDERRGSVPLRGIGFAQDVGGAIKRNRIDIFCGGDARANYVASHLDAQGPGLGAAGPLTAYLEQFISVNCSKGDQPCSTMTIRRSWPAPGKGISASCPPWAIATA